jgi:hypothetical protein
MIISVHQPQYLAWIGYFHKILKSDAFVFLDDVQYKEREYQNRNRIKTKDGSQWLTVPVLKSGQRFIKINEAAIDNGQKWQKRHWKAICLNYSQAPYFKQYSGFFEDLYSRQWDKLVDLNIHMIKGINGILGIQKDISLSSQLGVQSAKTQRIIDICRALQADTYLSGQGGKDYLEEELIASAGLKLIYQDFRHPEYVQCYDGFLPYMSMIDLLFNCGKDALSILERG